MKVLHVIDSSGIYGAEVMLLNLMREQQALGVTPALMCFADRGTTKQALCEAAVDRGVRTVCFSPGAWSPVAAGRRVCEIARALEADLIHSHGYKGDILLGLVPRARRQVAVVSTIHGWISVRIFTKIWCYCTVDKLMLRRLDAVVNVTTATKSISGVRRFIVENGIPELAFDLQSVLSNDRAVSSLRRSGCLVGTVSRLSEEKGVRYLIDAVGRLVRENYDVRAAIVGDGPQRGYLQKLIDRQGLSERVVLVGFKEQAHNYIPLFDVFVLPSLTEGMPMTILEAMQAGVPIVASRVGGVPDVLGHGDLGILVKPRDAAALAAAVSSVLAQRAEAARMADRARHVALDRYSSLRMAEGYLRVYREVLGKC